MHHEGLVEPGMHHGNPAVPDMDHGGLGEGSQELVGGLGGKHRRAGLMPVGQEAQASSPLTAFLQGGERA